MSIEPENPDNALGMVDAAANYVAQIQLALRVRDVQHAGKCAEQAARLLFGALRKLEESNDP